MTGGADPVGTSSSGAQDSLCCNGCGAQAGMEQCWGWSIATDERGVTTTLCADCAREHARSIEAKLDDSWW